MTLIIFLWIFGFLLMADGHGKHDTCFEKEGLVGTILVILGLILLYIIE
jgi:hypothetical protein